MRIEVSHGLRGYTYVPSTWLSPGRPPEKKGMEGKKRLAPDPGEDRSCQSALPRPINVGLSGGAGEPAYTGRGLYV